MDSSERVIPVLRAKLTHNPRNPQRTHSPAVTLRMVDTSTHALLLAAHKEAGTGAVRAGGGAGGGMALVQRAAQMLVACAPPRVLEAEQSMAAWQRMGLPLPEVRAPCTYVLP